MLSNISRTETRDAWLVKDFSANKAASSSSSLIWRERSSPVHGPFAEASFKAAPHPEREASEKMTRSGSSVESGLPLTASTFDAHQSRSEMASLSREIIADRFPSARADSFKN